MGFVAVGVNEPTVLDVVLERRRHGWPGMGALDAAFAAVTSDLALLVRVVRAEGDTRTLLRVLTSVHSP